MFIFSSKPLSKVRVELTAKSMEEAVTDLEIQLFELQEANTDLEIEVAELKKGE